MADFVDLYEELGLNPALECSQIEKELKTLRKKWRTRQNAPTVEARQEAELKSKYIDEALEKLTDESKRSNYDYQLRQFKQSKPKGDPTPTNGGEKPKEIDYNDVDSLLEIINQMVEGENIAELQRFTLNVINHGVQNDMIYYWYARACTVLENYYEAEKGFKGALALSPHTELFMFWYAELLWLMKKYAEAKELYSELYHNGNENEKDVIVGLLRCMFALEQESLVDKIVSDYIQNNPADMNFKKIAQREYLDAIARIKATILYQEPTEEQIALMLSYAKKADAILSNTRSKEAIEEWSRQSEKQTPSGGLFSKLFKSLFS